MSEEVIKKDENNESFLEVMSKKKSNEKQLNLELIKKSLDELNESNRFKQKRENQKNLIDEIHATRKELESTYKFLSDKTEQQYLNHASEWFLDNFHIIAEQLSNIKRDFPKNYYKELPKTKEGVVGKYPRIYELANSLIEKNDAKLDIKNITEFVQIHQKKTLLTIGELWAIPITLRISLLKRILPITRRIIFLIEEKRNAEILANKILNMAVRQEVFSEELIESLKNELCEIQKFNRPFLVHLLQKLRDQDSEIFKTIDWLENLIKKCGISTAELIETEHLKQAEDQVLISNIIKSMRLFSNIDWHDFFEKVSIVEKKLQEDPKAIYHRMDLETKDIYRKAVEKLSKNTSYSEQEISEKIIQLATEANQHAGKFLFGKGLSKTQRAIGYKKTIKENLTNKLENHPGFFYFPSIIILMGLIYQATFLAISEEETNKLFKFIIGFILLIPASELSIAMVNYIVTILKKPSRLPKLSFREGVPNEYTTMVIVPCLFSDKNTISELIKNLEIHYLSNQDKNIYFGLIGDFCDSKQETTSEDADFLNYARKEILNLNMKYNYLGRSKFFMFSRRRLLNKSEAKWMGWERKRGKLEEFNKLIRGNQETSFHPHQYDISFLRSIKYIITLDADTQLPLESAKKLIGTIAHPLNKAVFDDSKDIVVEGYAIIQPRISVSLESSGQTKFSLIFSGNTGIDPYTTAVSDVYQDLFSEGTYTGKGIYDVDAFERSLKGRVPENTILSHDLFEGSFARVGLATDIELIDEYPSSFNIYSKRLHRWTRGDWQILKWLFPFVKNNENRWVKNHIPYVSRWKILDNLRRSLFAPATAFWLTCSWLVLPGSPFIWTLGITFAMSFPVFASTVHELAKYKNIPLPEHLRNTLLKGKIRTYQIFLMLVHLPEMAFIQFDAIIKALYRQFISKKKMLEWISFSQIKNNKDSILHIKSTTLIGPISALLILALIYIIKPESFTASSLFLLVWFLAPIITILSQSNVTPLEIQLEQGQINKFRIYARLTWHFFEKFINEDNHWLAPDNFQEDPRPIIAHRTSPTNIGLQLLSQLSAYDLGYIGIKDFIESTEKTLNTIYSLEKYKGHLYNWYDIKSLAPLNPRYISTVDSGNLAAHLITLKQGCLGLINKDNIGINTYKGFLDTLWVIEKYIYKIIRKGIVSRKGSLQRILNTTKKLTNMSPIENIDKIENLLNQLKNLTLDIDYEETDGASKKIETWIYHLEMQIKSHQKDFDIDKRYLRLKLKTLAYQAHDLAFNMDFKFLFDDQRKIFVIGYNANESKEDESFYDLFASEARLTSFFAISKGDIPSDTWFRLGRPLTKVAGGRALISWSATMFEYLMPLLVMKRFRLTLLDQTYLTVLNRQIEYGKENNIPWGVSESGYYARDLDYNYQYGPFGIPGLGLKRGLQDEIVISPYSTMLAALIDPKSSLENLEYLESIEVLGDYGFYESIDYTKDRLPKNKDFIIVRSFMAHHQGMSLVAMNNIINNFIFQERFHSDPRNKSMQLLLQERIPPVVPIISSKSTTAHITKNKIKTEIEVSKIFHSPSDKFPVSQILSNGSFSLMMTTGGSGYTKLNEKFLGRWVDNSTSENSGLFIFIKDIKRNKIWSSGYFPTLAKAQSYQAVFNEDKIDIIRVDNDILTTTEVLIAPEDNVELRKLTLTNRNSFDVELEITSYLELCLAPIKDMNAHPTFSKLFIQTDYDRQRETLLANRRARSSDELSIWAFHTVKDISEKTPYQLEYETSKSQFIGRGNDLKTARVINEDIKLSNTVGSTLDPIFSIRKRIKIKAKSSLQLVLASGLTSERDESLRLAEKYRDFKNYSRELSLSWVKSQMMLRHLNVTAKKAHEYQKLASRILFLSPITKNLSNIVSTNTLKQADLWPHGISGDNPIILIQIKHESGLPVLRDIIHAHEYFMHKGLVSDLVILNEKSNSYLQTLNDEILRQIYICNGHNLINKNGGIFVLRSDLLSLEEKTLVMSVSRVILNASNGSIEQQLSLFPETIEQPNDFLPKTAPRHYSSKKITPPPLLYFNGFGGFSLDGSEYIVHLKGTAFPPTPWINIVSNKNDFGFMISESGQGYTWNKNSRENKLTPWSNDPVCENFSEVIYIRDEETGEIWSPTPLPVKSNLDYLIRHGMGFSIFEHYTKGIHHNLTLFVPTNDTIKIYSLKLKNNGDYFRILGITTYIEWVLGVNHYETTNTIFTKWDEETSSLLAQNSYNNEFSEYIAFFSSSEEILSFTCDKKIFLGKDGSFKSPKSLSSKFLLKRIGGRLDACGVLQTKIQLKPGEEKEIIFLIGQGEDMNEVRNLVKKYKNPDHAQSSLDEVKSSWKLKLRKIKVTTPDPSLDILINYWLPYQTLACRIWARSAFYQSGGAFGFRDQLQDVMAFTYTQPQLVRNHILHTSSRQFEEGDVQHWWHPPTGRGVRTRFADDLLWLPFVVSYYVNVTSDFTILRESTHYLKGKMLKENQDEIYYTPEISEKFGTLYEHCIKAIDRSLGTGSHGIPLFGSGDWNDGMNRVGHEGKGESVWMAWFIISVLSEFKNCVLYMNDLERIKQFENHIKLLRESVDNNAWDGEWFLRGFFDNGQTLGSHLNKECQIDSIAQSWSVISNGSDKSKTSKAMESAYQFLVDEKNKIIKLFTPPFDTTELDPGYIKGYVPGVRENGGQYTHAAIWMMIAFCKLNDSEKVWKLLNLLNPILHTRTPEEVKKYQVEPYVMAADIYSIIPNMGRGGWTWYTGSASWMYRAILEDFLGFKIKDGKLYINPCIPKEWDSFKINYHYKKSEFEINVMNNQMQKSISIDGTKIETDFIYLIEDGKKHEIIVHLSQNQSII